MHWYRYKMKQFLYFSNANELFCHQTMKKGIICKIYMIFLINSSGSPFYPAIIAQ